MAQINLKKTDLGLIETPAEGYVALAVKSDGTFIGKDSTGFEVGVGFSGDYDDLTNKPTGITSSFEAGWYEFVIENGIITQQNDIWTYEGVLTVGIFGGTMYGYDDNSKFGSILPTSSIFKMAYWSSEDNKLSIGATSLTTIGKVIIDEGEIGTPMSYTGTPAGCSTPITITADEDGVWNGFITSSFDGIKTIADGILAHNIAEPTHTVTLTSGDGSQVPNFKVKTDLTGGSNGEFSFEASDFTIAGNKAVTVSTTTNPFPIEAVTHTIKLQYI